MSGLLLNDPLLFLRTFADAPLAIAVADTTGCCVAANRAFGELVGEAPDDLRRLGLLSLVHPDDCFAASSPPRQLLEGKSTQFQAELRLRHRDGRFLVNLVQAWRVRDDRGKTTCFVFQATPTLRPAPKTPTPSGTDNPDRRVERLAAELALVEKQLENETAGRQRAEANGRQWSALVNSSDDAIIGKALDGSITSWNPGAERMFGYTAGEAVGQSIEILVPAEQSHAMPELMARIREGGHVHHYETVRVHKDGTLIEVSLGLSPVKDASGKTVGISTIARNISDRKRSERLIGAQHNTTRVLANSNSLDEAATKLLKAVGTGLGAEAGALWLVDREARVMRCRELWSAVISRGKRIDTAVRPVVLKHGEGLPGRVWATARALWLPDAAADAGLPHAVPLHAEGFRVAFCLPILLGKEVLGALEFFSTEMLEPDQQVLAMAAGVGSQLGQFVERKQAEQALHQSEEQLRQAQKMEAVGRLAGGVAHDFNNSLTAIMGYTDLMLAGLEPSDPLYADLREVRKAAEQAALLTKQLLTFSRKQVLAPKVLDLNLVIADTKKMLQRVIGEDVLLVTSLEPGLGRVKADPGQLEQVIMNLAVNARDAMPTGGKLTIRTANVALGGEVSRANPDVRPGHYVSLAVTDTGCGMDREVKARLFEPFFTTKGLGKGTGLGLATVYGSVKQNGGHIEVQSEPGKGSTFTLYLPRTEEPVPLRKSHPGLRKAPSGRETVLLVEDADTVRSLAKQSLQTCGYTVLEGRNGEEGLRIAQEYKGAIHLLVSDVVMPGMGGGQLAQLLSSVRPGIKVLFVSGYTDDAVVRHGVSDEEVAFLPKPFSPAALAYKVREVLDDDDG